MLRSMGLQRVRQDGATEQHSSSGPLSPQTQTRALQNPLPVLGAWPLT